MSENGLSIDRLRNILDGLGFRHAKIDGAIYAIFKGAGFSKPLACVFIAGTNKIQAVGWEEGFSFDGSRRVEGLEFCNQWNCERVNPRAYLDRDGDLRVDMTLFTDTPLTDEYVEENFARLFVSTAKQCYEEAAQKFG